MKCDGAPLDPGKSDRRAVEALTRSSLQDSGLLVPVERIELPTFGLQNRR